MITLPKLIIVVPCYNEEAVLHETNRKLSTLCDEMIRNDLTSDCKIYYVDDGSKDTTWNIILHLSTTCQYACGIKLARNVGHQNALLAGLHEAKNRCDIAISIDADLQDDIHVIPQMVQEFLKGNDIVYGVRNKRESDTWFKRSTALAFYRLMHMLGVNTIYNHADFRLMSSRALDQLYHFRERNLFLRGLVPLIGYHTSCVYYDRSERLAGESKYPFTKMLNFAIEGVTSFSIKPVRLVFILGIIFLLISVCILCYVIISILNHQVVPGWSSIMLSIWFVGASILMGLGIVGEYIGKIYIEVKDRPRYNIEINNIKKDVTTSLK